MKKLRNLKPERVFYYFEKICSIPHGSGNTKQISDFCAAVAKDLNLEVIQDDMNNIIIKKPATKGKENSPGVVIQGHLDMVCEKTADCDIDFFNDGLDIYVEDGFVKAKGTTLGGDDGIAVAMALAILEAKDIAHPDLEVLFTVDEETGMYGAQALDGSLIKGRMLLNIDSEDEGIFTVSCAGGINAVLTLGYNVENNEKPCCKITVDGLMGGHSGVDIDKGRLNSNQVAAAFLKTLDNFNLVSINGGLKANAIPSYTEIIIATEQDIENLAEAFALKKREETDAGLKITVEAVNKANFAMTDADSAKVVDYLFNMPNGIIGWSKNIEGLVETSLNLGILKTEKENVVCSFALRSSVNCEKYSLLERLTEYSDKFGGTVFSDGDYPAWEYKEDSVLRENMCRVYREMYGKEPEIIAIHAGLECGLLSEKLPGLDAVSIGPDMKDIHTPREKLSISSVESLYGFVIKLLGQM